MLLGRQTIHRVNAVRWIQVVYLSLGILALALLGFAVLKPIQVLPRGETLPSFNFIDQRGTRLSDWDVLGSITLYNVSYAGCLAPCPQTSQALRAVQDRLAGEAAGTLPVTLVTLSIDPDHDTPAALSAQAAALGADPRLWRFASGNPAQLKQLIGGTFGTYYTRRADGAYTVDPVVVLVDDQSLVRAIYRTDTPDIDRILRDIRLLEAEAQGRNGASRYLYELAHLFVCYPT
jgi:protein SCO1/2